MTGKTKLIEDLKEYFTSKGKFLTYLEYVEAEDAPFRAQIVKRHVGTWARLERLIGEIEAPKAVTKPAPKAATKTPVNPQITDAVTTPKAGDK
jgi:hypothetical protein